MTDFEKMHLSELNSYLKKITTSQNLIYGELDEIAMHLAKFSADIKKEKPTNRESKTKLRGEH